LAEKRFDNRFGRPRQFLADGLERGERQAMLGLQNVCQ
jgi:hypothetical protein